ncbi:MAG: flavodoxin family protein, partial [Chloroflexi bacterium]|nr:flavodoxin family protein [Chloroflexota bacterium]
MKTVAILGSRNPQGKTANAARAFLEGVQSAGGETAEVYLTHRQIERCRQCEENGWGLCRREGRCIIEDDFAAIVEQIRAADAVAFVTPVYYGDLSESMRAFTDRLRRIGTGPGGKEGLAGKPTVGSCVAGGGGGGAPNC